MYVANNRLSREDYKKKKELDELRKVGAAPAELDDEGKMINPHIPLYMAEAPWYVSDGRPGLKHQRPFKEKIVVAKAGEWAPRGLKKNRANRFRKGACNNCGAMTHKAKDCCERPRKRQARWTNDHIAPDEIIPKPLTVDYDGKRDRWNGYDINTHQETIKYSQEVEKARRKKKDMELDQEIKKKPKHKNLSESDTDSDSDESDESNEELKDSGILIQQMDSKRRQTVRNLRIREDTAKYLRNLDVNSAFYDPKTRSMRDNPYANLGNKDSVYLGDNFVRASGDTIKYNQIEYFAWQHDTKGSDSQRGVVHISSNPTKTETIAKYHKERELNKKMKTKNEIIKKYGGSEHFKNVNKELLFGQNEGYTEYNAHGNVNSTNKIRKNIPKSKYEEDGLEGMHKKIWGSYYDGHSKKWGYGCCKRTERYVDCMSVY